MERKIFGENERHVFEGKKIKLQYLFVKLTSIVVMDELMFFYKSKVQKVGNF